MFKFGYIGLRKESLVSNKDTIKNKAKNFGVVTVEGGRITSFREKPENPDTSLISIACYVFPRRVLGDLKEFCARGTKDNLGDFIRYLLNILPVYPYIFSGTWFDIGNENDYKEIIKGESK